MGRARNGTHPSRVREAAEALLNRGMRPTVQRVRAMLGGGSPNVIAPILKDWRETLTPEQQLRLPLSEIQNQKPELPLIISDLAAELWKRAIVFATIECKGSPQALQFVTMSEETEQLRSHNRVLLEQIESSANDNASLREQMAQLQAIAKAALDRARLSEERFTAASVSLRETSQALAKFRRGGSAKRKVMAHVLGRRRRELPRATKPSRSPRKKKLRSR